MTPPVTVLSFSRIRFLCNFGIYGMVMFGQAIHFYFYYFIFLIFFIIMVIITDLVL